MPLPVTEALSPIQACVFLVTTGTETAAPTAALPDAEILPAMRSSLRDSSAATSTVPSAVTTAPLPIHACVVMSNTETAAFTVTAAVPAKLPPAEIDSTSSDDV